MSLSVADIAAQAKEQCEGCRLAWRLKGWKHGEPMPITCEAQDLRLQLRNIEAYPAAQR